MVLIGYLGLGIITSGKAERGSQVKLSGPNGEKVKVQNGADFSGFEIDKSFVGRDIFGAVFRGAYFSARALDFSGTKATGLRSCDFTEAILEGTSGVGQSFISFDGSSFNGARLFNLAFWWCDFRGVSFSSADLTGTTFTNCNFTDADLSDALLSDEQLVNAFDDVTFNPVMQALKEKALMKQVYSGHRMNFD